MTALGLKDVWLHSDRQEPIKGEKKWEKQTSQSESI